MNERLEQFAFEIYRRNNHSHAPQLGPKTVDELKDAAATITSYRTAWDSAVIEAQAAEIGMLTGKVYALRDELARAYTDLADMHEGEGYHNDAKRYRARAAALEAPADGSADADADAADGSVLS
jgi:hypothetical protein